MSYRIHQEKKFFNIVQKSEENLNLTPEKQTLQHYTGITFLIHVNYLFGKLNWNVF